MERIEMSGVTLVLTAETAQAVQYELNGGWNGEMKRLVVAALAGDEMSWDIWSDMWKDEYGCRPRYTVDEIKAMYGLDK